MSIRAGVREIFTPQSFPFCISSAVMPPILMHISALVLTYIPDGPPDHVLVQGLNKVTHNLLGLTQVVGLYFPDLLVTDASEEVVTQGLVRATRRSCDLHVAEILPGPRNFSYACPYGHIDSFVMFEN